MQGDPATEVAEHAYIASIALLGVVGALVAHRFVGAAPTSRRLLRVVRVGALVLLAGVAVGVGGWLAAGGLDGDGVAGVVITACFLAGGILFSLLGLTVGSAPTSGVFCPRRRSCLCSRHCAQLDVSRPGPICNAHPWGDRGMLKVLTLLGTRPEAIKMAPVISELNRHADRVSSKVCVTAQHRGMLDEVLDLFSIVPDHDLDVMRADQSCAQVVAAIMQGLGPVLESEQPDWVLVQGDTTTVMTGALAAYYVGARVGHIEAGLRTYDKRTPFPEEIDRRIVSLIGDLHFAPTSASQCNLLREGIAPDRIIVTGNPVIDTLRVTTALPTDCANNVIPDVPTDKRLILVTAHRRESFGRPLRNICQALRDISQRFADVHIVYPVHPNPRVYRTVYSMLKDEPGITLLPPLDYRTLVQVMKRAYIVLSDSGGVQEEAPALGVPVLVMREKTERPEAVQVGAARVVGTTRKKIREEATRLLTEADLYSTMATAGNPYGDGHAAPRIVSAILSYSDARKPRTFSPLVPPAHLSRRATLHRSACGRRAVRP